MSCISLSSECEDMTASPKKIQKQVSFSQEMPPKSILKKTPLVDSQIVSGSKQAASTFAKADNSLAKSYDLPSRSPPRSPHHSPSRSSHRSTGSSYHRSTGSSSHRSPSRYSNLLHVVQKIDSDLRAKEARIDRRLEHVERLSNRERPSLIHKSFNLLDLIGVTPQKFTLKVVAHIYGSSLKSMVIVRTVNSTKTSRFQFPPEIICLIKEAIIQKFNLSLEVVERFWSKISLAINAKGRYLLYQYRKSHGIRVVTSVIDNPAKETRVILRRRLSK